MKYENQALRQLNSRVGNIVARALVVATTEGQDTQRCQLQIHSDEDEIEDDVENIQPYGYSAQLPSGTDDGQAVALGLGGSRSNTVALIVHAPSLRPTDAEPGSVGLYNENGWQLYITPTNEVHAGASGRTAASKLPRDDHVQTELARLKAELDAFKAAFDAHIHTTTAVTATGGPAGVISPPTSSFPAPASPGATATDKVYGT